MFTKEQLQKYIESGLVSERVHPEDPMLCIYNYTQQCQYEGSWDDVTMRCRGLILRWMPHSKIGQVVTNPFPKFFNYEEHLAKGGSIPNETPMIYTKYDGWFGVLYYLNDKPYIATRGSFESAGAVWATEWFRKYIDESTINKNYTYIFEIIAPVTKIVCHYPFSGLVYLTARETKADGTDVIMTLPRLKDTPDDYGGHEGDSMRAAEMIDSNDVESLKALEEKDKEGFVIHYPSGLRLKVKFDEYKRLHKIMTGLSEIGIWEALREHKDITIENVPDEFMQWFTDTVVGLRAKYQKIEDDAVFMFDVIDGRLKKLGRTPTRKEWADEITKTKYPQICFCILDKKNYADIIWKMVRPVGKTTYKLDEV